MLVLVAVLRKKELEWDIVPVTSLKGTKWQKVSMNSERGLAVQVKLAAAQV